MTRKYSSFLLKSKTWFSSFYTAIPPAQLSLSLHGRLNNFRLNKPPSQTFASNFSSLTKFVYNSKQNTCMKQFNCKWKVRQFHTTQRRYIPPILILILRPITKIGAMLVGRGIRKWWKSLPSDRRKYLWNKIVEQRFKIYVGTGILTGSAVIFYQTHLEETPMSKRERFILFDADKFDKISKNIFDMTIDVYQENITPVTHPYYKTVARVTDRLLKGNKDIGQIYKKSWSITIIDDERCNAFVLSNGQIFVFTGMIKFCENEDQLGCILGHEMAHAIMGHTAEILSYSHLIDLFMMVVIASIWAFLPSDLLSLLTQFVSTRISSVLLELPYNRMLEAEADEIGLELASKACFDTREIVTFWRKMSAIEHLNEEMPVDWLSTHPLHGIRAEKLDDLIPKSLALRKQMQCPPPPKLDPRETIKSYQEWAKRLQPQKEPVAVYLTVPQR